MRNLAKVAAAVLLSVTAYADGNVVYPVAPTGTINGPLSVNGDLKVQGNTLVTMGGQVGIGTASPTHTLHIITDTNNSMGIDSTGTDSNSMLHIKNTGSQGPFMDYWAATGRWAFGISSNGNFVLRQSAVGTDPVNGTEMAHIDINGGITATGVTVSTLTFVGGSAPPNSQALCLLGGIVGHCTSVVSVTGGCTCVAP